MTPHTYYDIYDFIDAVNKASPELKPKLDFTYLTDHYYDYATDGSLVHMETVQHRADMSLTQYDLEVLAAIDVVLNNLGKQEIMLKYWW